MKRYVGAALACAVVASLPLLQGPGNIPVSAQQGDRKALAERARERLRQLRAEAQSLLARERTLLVELRRLEVERKLKTEEAQQFERDAAQIEEELADTTRHLTLLRRAHDDQAPALRARLREIYKLGSGGYVRLLFALDHPRDLGRALRTVSALAAQDRERVRAHQSTMASLAAAFILGIVVGRISGAIK